MRQRVRGALDLRESRHLRLLGRGGLTSQTLMIESGEDLGVVSRILGHADFATTADVYAHLTPAMLDRAAERMDAILSG